MKALVKKPLCKAVTDTSPIKASVPRLIIGISGASGFQYGVALLKKLQAMPIETHLLVSKSAHQVRNIETDITASELKALADINHPIDDIACSLASGSYLTLGMIVAPCSMKTLAEIANGHSSNALTRAADVVLKERRRLVLMVRETPLNQAHLENMLKVSHMGGIIAPPVPAFYNNPETLDDIIDHSVSRVLDLFDIHTNSAKRWGDE